MATLNERSNEQRLKKQKIRRRILFIIIGVLIVVFIIAVVLFIREAIRTKQYTGYKTVNTFERVDSNTVKYCYYGGNLIKYSRDGASALDEDGNALWNGSYEMQNPIIDICGKFAAIADLNEKEFYVFNGSDSGTLIDAEYPITMIQVASQGVVAVMLENEKSNIIRIYDPYSKTEDSLLVEIPTNVSTDGYPVDMVLSDDGQSLVTSYLSMNNREAESNVCFYNFSEVGQDKNRIVGGCSYKESIVSKLEFIGNDTLCIFQDNGFTLYSNMKQPEEVVTEYFDESIRSVVYDDDHVGFIFDVAENADTGNHLKLYDKSGKIAYEGDIDYEYSNVTMCDDEIIFCTDNKCAILRADGSEKLNCTTEKPFEYFIKASGSSNYFLIDSNDISKVKLTED